MGPIPGQHIQKNTPHFSNIDVYIILLNSIYFLWDFVWKLWYFIHHLRMSQISPSPLVISQDFYAMKGKLSWNQRQRQFPCAPEQHGWCTVLTVGKPHTLNSLGDVNELNDTVPMFTNFVLSASCVVNSFADAHFWKPNLLRQASSQFSFNPYFWHTSP